MTETAYVAQLGGPVLVQPPSASKRRLVDASNNTIVLDGANYGGTLVPVTAFGATGDGVTDDTAAVQAAIDAQTGPVYFPPGTYSVSGIRAQPKTVLVGANCGTVISPGSSSGANLSIVQLRAGSNAVLLTIPPGANGGTVRALQFDGNRAQQTIQNDAISFVNGSATEQTAWVFCDVVVLNAGRNGIAVNSFRINNRFYNISVYSPVLHGLQLNSTDNYVLYALLGLSGFGNGLAIGGGFNHIFGADVFSNAGYNIFLAAGAVNTTLVNTEVDLGGPGGIYVNCKRCNIIGCTFQNNSTVTPGTGGHIVVDGNSNVTDGINISECMFVDNGYTGKPAYAVSCVNGGAVQNVVACSYNSGAFTVAFGNGCQNNQFADPLGSGKASSLLLQTGTTPVTSFETSYVSSAVNHWIAAPSATGQPVKLTSTGTDGTVNATISSKGLSSAVNIGSDGGTCLAVTSPAFAPIANYVSIFGNVASASPTVQSAGSDTNVQLQIKTKGTGDLQLRAGGNTLVGNGSAIATNSVVGFFALNTCAGTPTGAPTGAGAGYAPMIVDTTGSKLWVYLNGAWKSTTLA